METVTEDAVKIVFAEYGDITSLSIACDAKTGKSKGFCYINFKEFQAAKRAVDQKNATESTLCPEGEVISVARFQNKAEREAELKEKIDEVIDYTSVVDSCTITSTHIHPIAYLLPVNRDNVEQPVPPQAERIPNPNLNPIILPLTLNPYPDLDPNHNPNPR